MQLSYFSFRTIFKRRIKSKIARERFIRRHHSGYEEPKKPWKDQTSYSDVCAAINTSLEAIAPAWPLQNMIATNPLWFLKKQNCHDALIQIGAEFATNLFLSPVEYLELYGDGHIKETALAKALAESTLDYNTNEFITASNQNQRGDPKKECFHWMIMKPGKTDERLEWSREVTKFCAAYFDSRQAAVRFPWQSGKFWQGWKQAQKYDCRLRGSQRVKFREHCLKFDHLSSHEAITKVLFEIKLREPGPIVAYLRGLLSLVYGWATHFRYYEWEHERHVMKSHGVSLLDLLAVLAVYDSFYLKRSAQSSLATKGWQRRYERWRLATDNSLNKVWQDALDFNYQEDLQEKLLCKTIPAPTQKLAHMVFCIDVRSETIRRHIESIQPKVSTSGFAGFFGAGLSVTRTDESEARLLLPALLTPKIKIVQKSQSEEGLIPQFAGYIRKLRKGSLASFSFVELFGIFYIFAGIKRLIYSYWRPARESSHTSCSSVTLYEHTCKTHSLSARTDHAAQILAGMGIGNFPPFVLLVGHGAKVTNNALSSALHCGACGGHSGEDNASYAADLLNDSSVRKELSHRKIAVPDHTYFVACIHETVTDKLSILPNHRLDQKQRLKLETLVPGWQEAAKNCQIERHGRSIISATLSSNHWAELRPEWGLSGNASFIVAPRCLTRDINLKGRSFLHEYNEQLDPNFKILEQIMTAPMIVTHWINMQYYCARVSPEHFSSGDKIIHNITGEIGVIEGGEGDLRNGLSRQSIHDGNSFVHTPQRLMVIIAAPEAAIRSIVDRHEVLRDIIYNRWVYLYSWNSKQNSIERVE